MPRDVRMRVEAYSIQKYQQAGLVFDRVILLHFCKSTFSGQAIGPPQLLHIDYLSVALPCHSNVVITLVRKQGLDSGRALDHDYVCSALVALLLIVVTFVDTRGKVQSLQQFALLRFLLNRTELMSGSCSRAFKDFWF